MASFQQQPPTRIKLRRDAIIHAMHSLMIFTAGDDEALNASPTRYRPRYPAFEDIAVLSVCLSATASRRERCGACDLHHLAAN